MNRVRRFLSPPKAGLKILFRRQPRVPLATLALPWAKFCRLLRRLGLYFLPAGSSFRLQFQVVCPLASLLILAVSSSEALARVGGGQGYGGGGSGGSGGGGGGGLGALVYLLIRFLLWLTIEHPAIGIPVDIIVIAAVIYWFAKPSNKAVPVTSSSPMLGLDLGPGRAPQQSITQAFNQLRRFDPNFSEIIFTDFSYALFGRAHDARGKGKAALDELSPYLSDAARASHYWVNGNCLTAYQLMALAVMRGVPLNKSR